MRFLPALFLLFPMLSLAQGVNFETGNWKAVLAKAKAENKMVYVDAFTTWCGPCKKLHENIFPQKEAGDKYNALFVNWSVDTEKGEGIALAKKYAVNAFPSHLFIDPETEAIVYRTTGAGDVALFNKNADIALEERKDPMTWEVYTKSFSGGKRDGNFLKAYLRKAEKLKKNNDAILDAYLTTINKNNLPDSILYFLEDQTHTIWNTVVPVLEANRTRLDARDTTQPYYTFSSQVERWLYRSYEVARDAKDEAQLARLIRFIETNIPDEAEADNQIFFYRKRYFKETGDTLRLAVVATEEVQKMASKSLPYFSNADAKTRKNLESQIRHQLIARKLAEGKKLDTLVALNMAENAAAFPSIRAADFLNSAAWKSYENKKATFAELQQAMKWSAKALEFSAPYLEKWAGYADTHASLLYRAGQKEEAILLEQEAVKALEKAGKKEKAIEYEQTVQQMKSGTY